MVRTVIIVTIYNNYIFFSYYSLTKDVEERPRFYELIEHPYIKGVEQSSVDVAGWYGDIVRQELELKQAHRK